MHRGDNLSQNTDSTHRSCRDPPLNKIDAHHLFRFAAPSQVRLQFGLQLFDECRVHGGTTGELAPGLDPAIAEYFDWPRSEMLLGSEKV
jgi:hypothetical protein